MTEDQPTPPVERLVLLTNTFEVPVAVRPDLVVGLRGVMGDEETLVLLNGTVVPVKGNLPDIAKRLGFTLS